MWSVPSSDVGCTHFFALPFGPCSCHVLFLGLRFPFVMGKGILVSTKWGTYKMSL